MADHPTDRELLARVEKLEADVARFHAVLANIREHKSTSAYVAGLCARATGEAVQASPIETRKETL